MKLERFVVPLEWEENFEDLTNEEKGIIFTNFFAYHKGEEVDLSNRIVSSVWKSIVKQIDKINHNYITRIENGKKGGRPKNNRTKTETKPNNNLTKTDKDKDKDKEKEKENEKEKVNKKEYFKLIADAMKYYNLSQEEAENVINDGYEIEDETIIL